MTPDYLEKLGPITQKNELGAPKIDGSILVTYGMVLAGFSVQDRLEKVHFFEETFLFTDTSMEVVLKMSFLIFSNAEIWFPEKELGCKRYKTGGALLTL